MLEVRRLTEDDWRDWRRMRLSALAADPDAFGSTLAQWSGPNDQEGRWRKRLADSPFSALIELDGAPAGMVGAFPEHGVVELVSLWVEPSARGRGVGEAAVAAVVGFAGEQDVLLSVRSANDHAIRLYERCGFVDEGLSADDPRERRMRRPATRG